MENVEEVRVKDAYGQVLIRRVMRVIGKRALLCTESEFNEALKEDRDPEGVAFQLADIQAL